MCCAFPPLVQSRQWPGRNDTVHSCGGSRGIDRVPFLASAWTEEPRTRKATQGGGAGQCLVTTASFASRAGSLPQWASDGWMMCARHGTLVGASLLAKQATRSRTENPCQLTPCPRPCSPTQLVTGALKRVKRETGESCAQAMSFRCCPRNGKRAKRQIHCARQSAWEGDACRYGPGQPLVSPETGPQHHVFLEEPRPTNPRWAGAVSDLCVPVSQGFACARLTPD